MSNKLGGSMRGTAYTGTNAVQPPDCTFTNVAPTEFDTNYSLLDLWLNTETQIAYILVSLAGNSTSAGPLAVWVPLNGASGGAITEVLADAGIPIVPTAFGEIFAFGGANINTNGTLHILTINLNDSISLPETTSDASQGVISIGPEIAIQMFGTSNVFIGSAGNLTLTGMNNLAQGLNSGHDLDGANNNTFYGVGSASQLVDGDNNIALGFGAASDWTGIESDNIAIGNVGVAGDENTMRLGTSGSGAREIDTTYIAGVFANTASLNANNGVAIVDVNDLVKMTRGVDGQVLIGANGSVGPVWANLTSNFNTIAISNGPGTINLEVAAGPTAVNCAFLAQNTPNLTNITGDGTVYTYGTTQDLVEIFDVGNNFNPATGVFTAPADSQYYLEITIDLTNIDADGSNDASTATAQIITTARTYTWNYSPSAYGNGGSGVTNATISFQQIVDMSSGDTATFTISTDNSGGGGNKVIGLGDKSFVSGHIVSGAAFGATSFTTESGIAVPNAGNLNVLGGSNIFTSATGPNTVTIDVAGTQNHSLLLGDPSGGINNLGVATNGQIPIGSTGADPVLATITAGANISVTNGAGSITIAATGGGGGTTWNAVAGTTQSMAVNNGYVTQNGALTTLTLPITSAFGSTLEITGAGAGLFTIAQNASQQIKTLTASSTIGTGGSVTCTGTISSIKLVCTVANTTWNVLSSTGNFTYV